MLAVLTDKIVPWVGLVVSRAKGYCHLGQHGQQLLTAKWPSFWGDGHQLASTVFLRAMLAGAGCVGSQSYSLTAALAVVYVVLVANSETRTK